MLLRLRNADLLILAILALTKKLKGAGKIWNSYLKSKAKLLSWDLHVLKIPPLFYRVAIL
jgi:hypothetical protein